MARASDFSFVILAGMYFYIQGSRAANFDLINNCSYTIWPAGAPGGGVLLTTGQSWRVTTPPGSQTGKFWGRTGCNFDASGQGGCATGDCGGVLSCESDGGVPVTVVEYSVNGYNNLDFYDVSLVDGFNIPLTVIPTNANCPKIGCRSNITASCPADLQVEGGCESACSALPSQANCCTGSYVTNCPSTQYTNFFKRQCPDAYSYVKDNSSNTYTCQSGTDYKIIFCP